MSHFRETWRDWFAFFSFILMFAVALFLLAAAIWLLGAVL